MEMKTYLKDNYDKGSPIKLGDELAEMREDFDFEDKIKEENYYKYHENLANYDPKG